MGTVIGHQRDKGWILIDAGWMAMSQDRGTAKQAVNQGYGVVCDLAGNPYPDLILADANQEHGIITLRPVRTGNCPIWPSASACGCCPIMPVHRGAASDL
jgi:D-serine deaminase-like pyridoxal phosphate-dependent protein